MDVDAGKSRGTSTRFLETLQTLRFLIKSLYLPFTLGTPQDY